MLLLRLPGHAVSIFLQIQYFTCRIQNDTSLPIRFVFLSQAVKKKKKTSSFHAAKSLQRKLAKQSGFYDGRFREKIVKDKKKESSKKWARKKVDVNKEQ